MATRRATKTEARPSKAPARGKRSSRKRVRRLQTTALLRWCILAVGVFVAFLYYQPLSSYVQTRSAMNERAAEVEQLRHERARLQARLADSATVAALSREARRMRLVRPGERMFIVKGVEEWRRAQARANAGATIGGDG